MLSEMKKTNVRTNRMGPKANIIINSGKIRVQRLIVTTGIAINADANG